MGNTFVGSIDRLINIMKFVHKISRLIKITFVHYFSLGVSSERRGNEIKRLNNTYQQIISSRKGIKECLDYMVDTESYRWICRATYSLVPQTLRSERLETEKTFVQDSVIFFFIFFLLF